MTEDRVGGFEDTEVDVVFSLGEGEDELLGMELDGCDVGGLDARR